MLIVKTVIKNSFGKGTKLNLVVGQKKVRMLVY